MNSRGLRRAASASHIALSYINQDDNLVEADKETIEKMLWVMHGTNEPDIIWDGIRRERLAKGLPSIIVAWNGTCKSIWLWLEEKPDGLFGTAEDENRISQTVNLEIDTVIKRRIRNKEFYRVKLICHSEFTFGYYRLNITVNNKPHICSLISAPEKSKTPEKIWGVFAPTYALHSDNNQGFGGYKDLYEASKFIHKNGGSFIGTLPLLSVSQEENSSYSPYSPTSRLFWNEAFLDVTDLPEHQSEAVDFTALNNMKLADYASVYKIKKTIIQKAALSFFDKYPEGNKGFKLFLSEKAYLPEYAEYLAKGDEYEKKYHLYAQYACHLQISRMKSDDAAKLYLDYPVGVDPNGFDAKYFSHLFLDGFTVGAPPDKLGPQGQNWGFKPFNPSALLEDGFIYFTESLEHYFCYSDMIRIDHVMGLYRIFCIPDGENASKGVYIHYPFNVFLAILCLEAWKHKGILIGENLGTVPEVVNSALKHRGILRMWIAQFEMKPDPDASFANIEADMMAGLNTHDTPPFEAFLKGADIPELLKLDIISESDASKIKKERDALLADWKKQADVLFFLLPNMAASPAACVIVSMEDLWHETEPQNFPGTSNTYPNWRKKFTLPIEDWPENHNIKQAFEILNAQRAAK